jgi:hypothetical protein
LADSTSDIFSLVGNVTNIGLSSIISFAVLPGQNATSFKFISGTTLWFGGSTLTWGVGYPVSVGEIINIASRGNVYFAAQGSTAIIGVLYGRSGGVE